MTTPRRFPPPWTVIEHTESFEVRDAMNRNICYVYFEDENEIRRHHMGRMTKVDAYRIAANIAKLPELLGKTK